MKLFKIILLYCVLSMGNSVRAEQLTENNVKAIFIVKINPFIKWTHSKITICTLGEDKNLVKDSVGENIDKIIASENNNLSHKKIEIINGNNCDILFISNDVKTSLNSILTQTENKPIVTISDISGFNRRGGMFEFFSKNNKINLELNYTNAKQNNVTISAELLEMIKVTE